MRKRVKQRKSERKLTSENLARLIWNSDELSEICIKRKFVARMNGKRSTEGKYWEVDFASFF